MASFEEDLVGDDSVEEASLEEDPVEEDSVGEDLGEEEKDSSEEDAGEEASVEEYSSEEDSAERDSVEETSGGGDLKGGAHITTGDSLEEPCRPSHAASEDSISHGLADPPHTPHGRVESGSSTTSSCPKGTKRWRQRLAKKAVAARRRAALKLQGGGVGDTHSDESAGSQSGTTHAVAQEVETAKTPFEVESQSVAHYLRSRA